MFNRRQTLQVLIAAAVSRFVLPRKFASAEQPALASKRSNHQLRVLTYNVWTDCQGGRVEQTATVIKTSKADLVGLQEVSASGVKLAELTGLTYHPQKRGGILTRFPIDSVSNAGLGVRLKIAEDQYVWLFNVHLHHEPYQPYQLAEIPYGNNPFVSTEIGAIQEAKRARSHNVAELLQDIQDSISDDQLEREPIFLTGDFNEPSHLDWTTAAHAAGLHQLPVQWPHSIQVVEAGFKDSYREVYPDEIAHPGLTWTPVPSEREIHDRIDFVYHRNAKATQAEILGESAKTSDLVVTPYPSDHRAVVVNFEIPSQVAE